MYGLQLYANMKVVTLSCCFGHVCMYNTSYFLLIEKNVDNSRCGGNNFYCLDVS